MKILIINGPNLNMLGKREPDLYGNISLKKLNHDLKKYDKKVKLSFYTSNIEGKLVSKIQKAKKYDGIIINGGAYSHTSIAIMDAFKSINFKNVVNVHISDVEKREDFRQNDYLAMISLKTIKGHGIKGYFEAIDYLKSLDL